MRSSFPLQKLYALIRPLPPKENEQPRQRNDFQVHLNTIIEQQPHQQSPGSTTSPSALETTTHNALPIQPQHPHLAQAQNRAHPQKQAAADPAPRREQNRKAHAAHEPGDEESGAAVEEEGEEGGEEGWICEEEGSGGGGGGGDERCGRLGWEGWEIGQGCEGRKRQCGYGG